MHLLIGFLENNRDLSVNFDIKISDRNFFGEFGEND